MERIAAGFDIPVERVRTAAARSLVGYADDGAPLTADLSTVSVDALLNEIRRRVNELEAAQESGTPRTAVQKNGAVDHRSPNEAQADAAALDLADRSEPPQESGGDHQVGSRK